MSILKYQVSRFIIYINHIVNAQIYNLQFKISWKYTYLWTLDLKYIIVIKSIDFAVVKILNDRKNKIYSQGIQDIGDVQ